VHTTINRSLVDSWEVVSKLVASEFSTLTVDKAALLTAILTPQKVSINAKGLIAGANGIFTAASASATALTALLTRNGSRAEFLFGENTVVSSDDVARAKNS
jgi:hypothetical protein